MNGQKLSVLDYVKLAAPVLPGMSQLPGIRKTGDVADLQPVTLRNQALRPADVAAFNRVCGFTTGSYVPATYPHVLGFATQMKFMTNPKFPFPGVGLVHVANTIRVLDPLMLSDVVDLTITVTAPRPHPAGKVIDFVTTAHKNGDVVWDDVSTYLHRGKGDDNAERPGVWVDEPPVGPTKWRLPGDLGRSYASVSGDRNPIHMSNVSAKAFGYSSAIAHGMWTASKALATVESRLPERYSYTVSFGAPILLPRTVGFGVDFDANGAALLAVTSSKGEKVRTHMVGEVSPLE